jgi:formylglycine-generating enzyme required for sulfatase activity
MSPNCFRFSVALAAVLLIHTSALAQSTQNHKVKFDFSPFGISDQGIADQATAVGVIGFNLPYPPTVNTYNNGTASFFYDNVFQAAHSVHLGGPVWAPVPFDPPPIPALANAARFSRSTTQALAITLECDFTFNPFFFFNPRGSLDGFVYFPESTGEVSIVFGMVPPGDTGLIPFFSQRVVNPGEAGALVPFGGTGRAPIGFLHADDTVNILLSVTNLGGSLYTLFLPGSLHVDFDPEAVPEPSAAVLLGLGGAIVVWTCRNRPKNSRGRSLKSRTVASLLLVGATSLFGAHGAAAATISTVPVGNPGNSNDTTGFGGVDQDYRIATFEVTNTQYAEFLNSKATSDPLSLYSTSMDSDPRGGITRSGTSGAYSYTVKPNMGDKPVNFVNWYDAIRFANWLHNGQGSGDTETGAYTLLGGTATPSNGTSVTRNSGAIWFLPSEHEWYKAAYHDPRTAAEGGPPGDDLYWRYPTSSDSQPVQAAANSVGDINNPGANVANWGGGADWNGLDGNVTTVGSAGPSSSSFYGTSDQGGNVWEWNEAASGSTFRRIRGGSWQDGPQVLSALNPQPLFAATAGIADVGFRVATIVPEPETAILFGLAALGLVLAFSRRKCWWAVAQRRPVATSIILFASSGPATAAMFNATNVAELISAINAANQNAEADSIMLAAGATLTLTQVDNSTHGSTGLPTITANEILTIHGNGGVIERSTTAGTPDFRLFDVAAGAALTLDNVTLQGGLTELVSPVGGAIYNAGALALSNVTVQNNLARGRPGSSCNIPCGPAPGGPGWNAFGGGIYSAGTLLLENSTLLNNRAEGGRGGNSASGSGGSGGNAYGGGLYVVGIATLYHSAVSGNIAQGGAGGNGGTGPPGGGYGGGIYISTAAQVGLDDFTSAHVTDNTASTNYPNIRGAYDLIPNPAPIPGDFNRDGDIDGADYVYWRKTGGPPADYNTWRTNFGRALARGAGSSSPFPLPPSNLDSAVPEPTSLATLLLALLLIPWRRNCAADASA